MKKQLFLGIIGLNLCLSTVLIAAPMMPFSDNEKNKGDSIPQSQAFDPKTYTCADFITHLHEKDKTAMIAVVWADGYAAGLTGLEMAPVLDKEGIKEDMAAIAQLCETNPKQVFSTALRKDLENAKKQPEESPEDKRFDRKP